MSDAPPLPLDDPTEVWGWMAGDEFRPLPKRPMLLANLGPPPFDVTLPGGAIRRVIVRPKPT